MRLETRKYLYDIHNAASGVRVNRNLHKAVYGIKMTRLALVMLGSLMFAFEAQAQSNGYYPKGGPDNGVQDVSMIQLIANPQTFDGKRVRMIGFLHLEFEGDAIYLHREDFQNVLSKNALWINVPKDMTHAQIEAVNNHYVICTGTFVAEMRGHMGLNSGEISKITRLQIWITGTKPRRNLPAPPPPPPTPPRP